MPDLTADGKKFELMQKRLKQKIQRPVIIYKKKTGEVVRGVLSSKVEEVQKVDRRSFDVIELGAGHLPQNIQDYIVLNGVLKKKSKKMLAERQKLLLEQQLVALNTQLEIAIKNELESAKDDLENRIRSVRKQIKALGVD